MKKTKPLYIGLAGYAIIMSATTYGQQQDSTKTLALNDVVVTATRSEKNINDIGRSINVITAANIKNSGASTIAELLNQNEGFYIVGAQQNPGSLSSIFTRGANGNHTVIMVDGIRITDPTLTDNSINLSELSLANIDRIEIVRGSHSTLYGSSAIGGVINIITNKSNQKPGVHVGVDLQGGAFGKTGLINTEDLLLNYTHKSGLYINAEIFNTQSAGFNSTTDTITNPNTYKHADMSDGFNKIDLISKIGYKTQKIDLYAGYKKVHQNLDIDDGAFKDDENYTMDFNRGLFTYGSTYKLNKNLSFQFVGGLSDIIREAVDDSSRVDAIRNTDKTYFSGKYKGTLANNELQFNYNRKGFQLVGGGGFNKETMTSQTYYFSNKYGIYESKTNLDSLHINASIISGFIHTDLNGEIFTKKLKPYSLGLGARIINHSTFGSMITYEINPAIKIKENTLFYLSFSTGFNAPSLYQLYSPEKDLTSGITRGNSTLNPEQSNSLEIGIKQKSNDNIEWSVCYFNTVVDNVVDYVYLWNKNTDVSSLSYLDYMGDTYINLGKQTNNGIEFSIKSKISDKLVVTGNFSLVSGKLEYKTENIDNKHTQGNHIQLFSNGAFISKEVTSIGLVRRPNTGYISIRYLPIKKLDLLVDINYVGSRNDIYYNSQLGPYGALGTVSVEDYTLLNFNAKYEIKKGLFATVRVENILNTAYYEIKGYATRGRGIYGGISYSF